MNNKIYALYVRDEFICDGTLAEIAMMTGKTRQYFLTLKADIKCRPERYTRVDLIELGDYDGVKADTSRRVIFRCDECGGPLPKTARMGKRFCSKRCSRRYRYLMTKSKLKRWEN